jgi:hypothetical protein
MADECGQTDFVFVKTAMAPPLPRINAGNTYGQYASGESQYWKSTVATSILTIPKLISHLGSIRRDSPPVQLTADAMTPFGNM